MFWAIMQMRINTLVRERLENATVRMDLMRAQISTLAQFARFTFASEKETLPDA